jgi:hypothetical protein
VGLSLERESKPRFVLLCADVVDELANLLSDVSEESFGQKDAYLMILKGEGHQREKRDAQAQAQPDLMKWVPMLTSQEH